MEFGFPFVPITPLQVQLNQKVVVAVQPKVLTKSQPQEASQKEN